MVETECSYFKGFWLTEHQHFLDKLKRNFSCVYFWPDPITTDAYMWKLTGSNTTGCIPLANQIQQRLSTGGETRSTRWKMLFVHHMYNIQSRTIPSLLHCRGLDWRMRNLCFIWVTSVNKDLELPVSTETLICHLPVWLLDFEWPPLHSPDPEVLTLAIHSITACPVLSDPCSLVNLNDINTWLSDPSSLVNFKWCKHLTDTTFTWIADSQDLQGLFEKADPGKLYTTTYKLQHWYTTLMMYHFTIEHHSAQMPTDFNAHPTECCGNWTRISLPTWHHFL